MTPYYEDENCTIFHGDCLEVLSHHDYLQGLNYDLIFTSPPYNKGVRTDGKWTGRVTKKSKSKRFRNGYGTHDDAMPWDEYCDWQRLVITTLSDLVFPDGALFYNHKPRIINGRLWTPLELVHDVVPLRQIITWHKINVGVDLQPGAFASAYEWLLLIAHSGFELAGGKQSSAFGDVWQCRPATTREHPAPFPLALPKRAIMQTGADYILDPFMGSGTTLRAAKDLGKKAIGIEIEEEFCEIAANRLAQGVMAV